MPDRNAESLMVVYRKAAELFKKLEDLVEQYKPHMALGMYEGELDTLVEEHVTTAADYDAAYKGLRQRRKEAEKLPNFEKVDCINVSLAPLKSTLEDQHNRLSNALQLGMARQAKATQHQLDTFITESLETLSKRPQDVDEISLAKKQSRDIEQVHTDVHACAYAQACAHARMHACITWMGSCPPIRRESRRAGMCIDNQGHFWTLTYTLHPDPPPTSNRAGMHRQQGQLQEARGSLPAARLVLAADDRARAASLAVG